MAHKEQQDFFARIQRSHPEHFANAKNVLEVGSQDINGTVRHMFRKTEESAYIGLDLGPGNGVDWVIPGELVELPSGWADITVSTECFEHCKDWPDVLRNMIRITKNGGLVLVTCAGTGRGAHGTLDSDIKSSPFTQSYYKNLSIDLITSELQVSEFFDLHGFEVNSISHDLYFWGIRSMGSIDDKKLRLEDPMDRLARCQGQLAQAAARQSAAETRIAELCDEKTRSERDLEVLELRLLELKEIKSSRSWSLMKKIHTVLDYFKAGPTN